MRARFTHTNASIGQYCPPRCFELAGRRFNLVMDDGRDYHLDITDGTTLSWCIDDGTEQTAPYECLKGDDTTYLVSFVLPGIEPRVNHTLVLDLENSLATRIIAEIGRNPRLPYLIYTDIEFGAIARDGTALPFKRHGYTSDLIGTVVQWAYGSEMATVHVYFCADFYRITFPRKNADPVDAKDADWAFSEESKLTPSSDEPARYIKIKDGLYLFTLIEQNQERVTQGKVKYRSNTLCFLQNYDRLYQVGRGFGTLTTDSGDEPIHIMIGAVGKFVDIDPSFLTDPNPYVM